MQASESGFFVHIHHGFGGFEQGVDLRLAEAKKFLAELEASVAGVARTHEDASEHVTGAGEAPAEEEAPSVEETKAEAKKTNSRSKK